MEQEPTSLDQAQAILNRISRLREFEVKRTVEQGWMPHGVLPFDVHIRQGQARFKVLCESQSEANALVDNYIDQYS
jgi:hypothetical protein